MRYIVSDHALLCCDYACRRDDGLTNDMMMKHRLTLSVHYRVHRSLWCATA